jgi:hypothetical protein
LISAVPTELKDPGMTAIMEGALSKIAAGDHCYFGLLSYNLDIHYTPKTVLSCLVVKTYLCHTQLLKKRNFLTVNKKQIISTDTGRALISAVPTELKDPGMTVFQTQPFHCYFGLLSYNLDIHYTPKTALSCLVVKTYLCHTLGIQLFEYLSQYKN